MLVGTPLQGLAVLLVGADHGVRVDLLAGQRGGVKGTREVADAPRQGACIHPVGSRGQWVSAVTAARLSTRAPRVFFQGRAVRRRGRPQACLDGSLVCLFAGTTPGQGVGALT